MTTTSQGREAECKVAEVLRHKGHTIVALNWRTRWCEIDIVSKKGMTMYFTEVKFRSSLSQGGGFDYVTLKKIEKMNFAAEMWIAQENWYGEACLLAAEVNKNYAVTIVEL